ncbi:hypothetical protein [Motilibacter aurantiacus]|uniref:hypothetical protein n=1 Tax=Motilibacter aurantiacus TaxID=2714955 RepID=UPI00140CA7E0|nr:hypothetical protein [Motilibacter aurantiacus]NHC46095.1 hypothetical protein [Motilibacter aurantiacus]
MSERAVPFHCPYCGEEDLRPSEASHAAWACGACLRVFTVKLVGLAVGGSTASGAGAGTAGGGTSA